MFQGVGVMAIMSRCSATDRTVGALNLKEQRLMEQDQGELLLALRVSRKRLLSISHDFCFFCASLVFMHPQMNQQLVFLVLCLRTHAFNHDGEKFRHVIYPTKSLFLKRHASIINATVNIQLRGVDLE